MTASLLHDAEGETPVGIVNGNFQIQQSTDSNFGWESTGDALVREDSGKLIESPSFFSGFQQTFEIPFGASGIRFNLVDVDLGTSPNNPADAFEATLLNAATGQPLVEPLGEFDGTESFFHYQATGEAYYGGQVRVEDHDNSGEQNPLNKPTVVIAEFDEANAGTIATLYFDLLGFGGLDSQVMIDDVVLIGAGTPEIEVDLDPIHDSGVLGDGVTNTDIVNLLGFTDPRLTVGLDTDGDGQPEQEVQADEFGRFQFQQVLLTDGARDLVFLASNFNGEKVENARIIVDKQGPSGNILSPANGGAQVIDAGYLDVDWTDQGEAGLDSATLDPTDLRIEGVTVDRVVNLDHGRYRYIYGDDGDRIEPARVTVRMSAGVVLDRAANGNEDTVREFFQLDAACPWQNPENAVDIDASGNVFPLDALLIINRLNRLGASPFQGIPSEAPITFYDTDCSDFSEPLDVLLVINHLNQAVNGESEALTSLDSPGWLSPSAPLNTRLFSRQPTLVAADQAVVQWESAWPVHPGISNPTRQGTPTTRTPPMNRPESHDVALTDILRDDSELAELPW